MREPLNVLVFARESSAPYRARLADTQEIRYLFCESDTDVAAGIGAADVILGSVSFPMDLLSRAARLRWIQAAGAGVDAFLSGDGLPEGVQLTRAAVSFGDQIAEYVIAHLLARTQRLREVHQLQTERRWEPLAAELVRGRTLGVAGTGLVGREVARRARAMEMRTLGLSRSGRQLPEFDACCDATRLSEFLPNLDVLVLCLPLTPETRKLIGRKELAVMKRSALLVNVARGAIVDETALIDALRKNVIGGAILDVFVEEPLPEASPLWAMDNVTITSHHSGLNVPEEIAAFFLANLARFRSGEPLEGLVDPRRGY